LLSDTISIVAARVARFGRGLGLVVTAALVAWIVVKYVRRRLFLRSLRIARILPEDLRRKLEAGEEEVTILDLRSAMDVTTMPQVIAGARWVTVEGLDEALTGVPRDRDVILYCS
jgi:hypothetical protein